MLKKKDTQVFTQLLTIHNYYIVILQVVKIYRKLLTLIKFDIL